MVLSSTLAALVLMRVAPAPDPVVQVTPEDAGFGLEVELVGSTRSVMAARDRMLADVGTPDEIDGSIRRGRVQTLREALSWVELWAFSGRVGFDPAIRESVAPRPGSQVPGDVHLVSLRVVPTAEGGEDEPLRWPSDPREIVARNTDWRAAALLPDGAPLFAAPAPFIPPAGERVAWAERRGDILVLGELDRCTPRGGRQQCLRWSQVLVRVGESFTPGYLPSSQVAPLGGWVQGETPLPRAQILPVGVLGSRATWLLVARADDGQLHRRTLFGPLEDGGFPSRRVTIENGIATVTFGDAPPAIVRLAPEMDARPSPGPGPTTRSSPAPDSRESASPPPAR